ncbi:MAG: GLPGLI family protein [Saprospiraceae bacterium]|nr:GLPGLI family protein [Saprospiraceae bacterium]
MKKLLILVILTLVCKSLSLAQEGVIIYEQKINMHRNALVVNGQDMRSMMPEFRINKMQLLFNANESLYKNLEDESTDEVSNTNGMTFRMTRPKNETYNNFKEGQRIQQREFMSKKFLIKGEIQQTPWKVSGEMEEVAGYNCMKATMTDTNPNGDIRNIAAWFTTDIPVAAGPETFGSLPGLILKLDINEGETVYTALSIDKRTLKKDELEVPSKGKEMTEEEFREMVQEQMKQMGGTPGGGQRMIIRGGQ